jgi:hypothetical protein
LYKKDFVFFSGSDWSPLLLSPTVERRSGQSGSRKKEENLKNKTNTKTDFFL